MGLMLAVVDASSVARGTDLFALVKFRTVIMELRTVPVVPLRWGDNPSD